MSHTATVGYGYPYGDRPLLGDVKWRYPRTHKGQKIDWHDFFTPYLRGYSENLNPLQMNRIWFGLTLNDPERAEDAVEILSSMVKMNRSLICGGSPDQWGLAPFIYMLFEGFPLCGVFRDLERTEVVGATHEVYLNYSDCLDPDRLLIEIQMRGQTYEYLESDFSYVLFHDYRDFLGFEDWADRRDPNQVLQIQFNLMENEDE